jgi:APA family basic amino acid/polyamine antiporter
MKKELKKELGLLDVFSIASGAMISSGLFILPALAYAATGPSVVFSYILAGILVLPALLTNAELATAMPRAGGTYFFIERSMGASVGTVGGFASWFSLCFKSAFALLGMSIFVTLLFPGISQMQIKFIAVGFCLFFMTLNIIGAKETGRLQIGLVFFLLGILLLYIIRGFMQVDPSRFVPFAPFGAASVFATAGLVFISFGGLTKVTSVAEEVRNPGRTIPLGMFLAFFVVMVLYAVVVFVTVGVLSPDVLSTSLTPISDGAGVFMGKFGVIALSLAALLAFISTANAGILAASRDGMAMSRDYLLPDFLQKIGARSKTPIFSIIFTTFFMIFIILFLSLENLVKTASTLKILLFLFVNLSLIVMRESRIQSYRPKFRCPLYPWMQILGIIGYGFLIFTMGRTPLFTTAFFILCSFFWYIVYARRRVKRQAALVHIIERITAKELTDATLPDELRDIIIERDQIVEDRFDKVIKESVILDLETKLSRDEFFKKASQFLTKKIAIAPRTLTELLIKREEESHTVIRPGLAIPHIVIEGEKKFCILLARAKKGIIFPDADKPVHTVFMLVGTRDERNFHLRALAAIAQIAQDENFDKKWKACRNVKELRNLILLAERKRFGVI